MALKVQFINTNPENVRTVPRLLEERNTYSTELGEENYKKMVQASYEINTPIPPDTPTLIPEPKKKSKKPDLICNF